MWLVRVLCGVGCSFVMVVKGLGSICLWGRGGKIILFASCLVDLMLARLACMCPLMVAVWSGGHRLNCLVVIVGKVARYLVWMAFARVERVGENRDL